MITETKIIFMTVYSFLKNYSTSASNIFREAFYHNYLHTVLVVWCKSVDIVFFVLQKVPRPFKAKSVEERTWCLRLGDALVHPVLNLTSFHLLFGHGRAQLVRAVVRLGRQRSLKLTQKDIQAVTDLVQVLDGRLVGAYLQLEWL